MNPGVDLTGLPLTPALFAQRASGGQWRGAPHLDHLNGVLFDAALSRLAGKRKNIIINAPPRHGKSEFVSRYFSAWWLCNFPDDKVLLTAYEATFAADWGVLARDAFETMAPTYTGRDGHPLSLSDQRAGSRWGVHGHDGMMRTAGAGGAILGKGGHCFPAGTMIETRDGPIDIAEIRDGVEVASQSEAGNYAFRPVVATSSRSVSTLARVRTDGGEFQCTPDHQIYVEGRGDVQAKDLEPGLQIRGVDRYGRGDNATISSVHAVLFPDGVRVYDIQVFETPNFLIHCGGRMLRVHNCIIIDDPIKNSEDALSEHFMEGLWNWWLTTVRTRREPGSVVIAMMQRWMEDDFIGRLLDMQERGGDQWEVVTYKALAEAGDVLGRPEGEALWPWKESRAELELTRRNSPFWFAAQYQQEPRPKDGEIFRGVWFRGEKNSRIVSPRELPNFVELCRFWDRAGLAGKGDYTVGCLVGRTEDEMFYVIDVVRGRWSEHERNKVIKRTAKKDDTAYGARVLIVTEQEGGSSGKDVAAQFVRMMAGYRVKTRSVTGNPVDLAILWADQVEAGNVRLVSGDWVEDFIREHEAYNDRPKHDDQVIAAAGAFVSVVAAKRSTFAASPTRGYCGKKVGDSRFGGRKTRLRRISYT